MIERRNPPRGRANVATSVIFMHPSDELYGADRVLLEIISAVPSEWEVSVWLPDDVDYPEAELSKELDRRGIKHRSVPLPVLRRANLTPRGLIRLVPRCIKTLTILRETRPTLVYVNTAALAIAVPLGRWSGSRVVAHAHEHLGGAQGSILSVLLSVANEVVAVSDAVRSSMPRAVRSGVTVIRNGFALQRHGRPQDRSRPLTFLFASRWNTWKGHALLLQAWAGLTRPDARLVILGGPPKSGAGVDVHALVADLEIGDSVTIVGESSDVAGALAASDVVLVPSTRPDPLPTIAIEAAAAGRAVVGSNHGGLPEIVDDGKTGWLVSDGTVSGWLHVLEKITPEQTVIRGNAARMKYEAMFSRDRFRDDVSRLLSEIVASE